MINPWIYPTAFSSWSYGDNGPESVAIDRVLRSGRFTMAGECEAFEGELAAYHGRRHAICVNSGSSANLVAVAALYKHDIKLKIKSYSGNNIALVPAIAWATTYAPCRQHLFDLAVFDVDDTWNVPPGYTTVDLVVTCPVLGNAAHSDDWSEHCRELNVYHLEDACESTGARDQNGRLCGTFGLLSTGSGFFSHQISCVEMGWVLTDDDELARRCRLLRNHGNDGWGAERWEDRYNFSLFGYNLRPLEMHAAVGREQLKKLDAGNEERRRNLDHFRSACLARGLPVRFPRMVGHPAPFSLAFEVLDQERRAPLVAALAAAGIDSRPPTGGSFTKHPYGAPWRESNPTPVADRIHDCGLFLGLAPWDITPLIEKAVKIMKDVL